MVKSLVYRLKSIFCDSAAQPELVWASETWIFMPESDGWVCMCKMERGRISVNSLSLSTPSPPGQGPRLLTRYYSPFSVQNTERNVCKWVLLGKLRGQFPRERNPILPSTETSNLPEATSASCNYGSTDSGVFISPGPCAFSARSDSIKPRRLALEKQKNSFCLEENKLCFH